MTRYESGASLEREVVNKLRKAGYFALRSAGSHSLVDVIACYKGIWIPMQCKKGLSRLSSQDRGFIYDFIYRNNCNFFLVEKKFRHPIEVIAMGGKGAFLASELQELLNNRLANGI